MMLSIERREWLWLALWTIIIVMLVSLPHLYATSLSSHYSGFVIGVEDGNSYLAKINQGRAGHWLFSLTYTPEEHPRALFFIHYIFLGHLARWFNMNLHLMLRLGWVAGVIFELISFYCFTAFFTDSISVRRLAFLLFSLTAGFGWLWLLAGFPAMLGQMPVDLWVPDTSFFLSALASPHLGLVHGLILWFMVGSLLFLDQKRFKFWLLAAGTGLLASLIQPYKLVVPGALLGLYWLWQVYCCRQSFWQGVWRLTLVALPSVPYLVYTLQVFETNPTFKSWRAQSPNLTPPPFYLLLGLGLLVPFMLVGLWQLRVVTFKHRAFLVIWTGIVPVFIYLPTLVQRRFLHGYQVPLTILAGLGLVYLLERIPRWRSPVLASVLLVMGLTNLFLLMGALTTVSWQQPPVFQPASQIAAFHWLDQNSHNPVVFTALETGNMLPVYVSGQVFVGHGPETINSKEKQQLVTQFFNGTTPDTWRQKLLQEYHIDYLFYSPNERILGDFLPDKAPYLQPVYQNGSVQIYRVKNF